MKSIDKSESNRRLSAAKEKLDMLQISLEAPIKSNVPDVIAKATKAQLEELFKEVKNEIKLSH